MLTAAGLVAAALLAGCGPQAGPGAQVGATDGAAWGDCTPQAYDEAPGPVVAVPTSGGTAEVKLPGTGPCAGGLVTRLPDGVSGLDVRGLDLDPGTARVVALDGGEGPTALLRVGGGRHPRGGFQPHLFVVEGPVQEVTVDGRPLLPFVATDGGMAPMTATCTDDGGVAVLSASTSDRPGTVLAWDVARTTYEISGAEAVRRDTDRVADDVADPVLRNRMPALFEPGVLFADCGADGP